MQSSGKIALFSVISPTNWSILAGKGKWKVVSQWRVAQSVSGRWENWREKRRLVWIALRASNSRHHRYSCRRCSHHWQTSRTSSLTDTAPLAFFKTTKRYYHSKTWCVCVYVIQPVVISATIFCADFTQWSDDGVYTLRHYLLVCRNDNKPLHKLLQTIFYLQSATECKMHFVFITKMKSTFAYCHQKSLKTSK